MAGKQKLTIQDLAKIREKTKSLMTIREGEGRARVTVHMGTCGIAAGARDIMDALLEEISKANIQDVIVTTSGCAGLCGAEPMMTIEFKNQPPVKYGRPDPGKAAEDLRPAHPGRPDGRGPRAGRRQRNRVLRGSRETLSRPPVGLCRHRLRLLRVFQDQGGPRRGDQEEEPPGRSPGRGHGLQRVLRAGPDRPGPAGRHLLPAPHGRRRASSRRGAPAQGPSGQEADVRPAGREASPSRR